MAIGWITVLQSVPWSEVIRNAPKVAATAKKLWNTVARKNTSEESPASGMHAASSSEFRAIAAIESRIGSLEEGVSELNNQMLASSEVIKALADQNTMLIQRIEINRVRMIWLAAATAAAVIIAVVSLYLALFRNGA
ncbi:MAG: hypothetical protein JXN64_05740 [Spirochaetes bacterium]|nr:hypothetical protein [Spirochaetota bacterium]